jgi:hypothetical protein
MNLQPKQEVQRQLGLTRVKLDRILQLSGVKQVQSPIDKRIELVDIDAVKAYLDGQGYSFPKGDNSKEVSHA